MADFVYFQQHESKSWIRIGFTGGRGSREDKQEDFLPVAVLQGVYADEQRLHELFKADRVERRIDRSTYNGERVHDYVSWLLGRVDEFARAFRGLGRIIIELREKS